MTEQSLDAPDQSASAGAKRRRFEAKIYGRVQGVGFRMFVLEYARALGLVGTVRNVYFPKRCVIVVAQGAESDLQSLLNLLHRGPAMARVEHVDVVWLEPAGNLTSFEIV